MTRIVWWMKSTDPQSSGFESGFNVSQQIFRNNEPPTKLRQGILPRRPRIPDLHRLWLEQYNSLNDQARIQWDHSMPRNIAHSDIEACGNLIRELEREMQLWLDSTDSSWLKIREELRGELGDRSSNYQVSILIQTDETLIWQLPWQFWDLLSQSQTRIAQKITFGHL